MSSQDLCWLSATELARAIKRKKVSPLEVTRAILAQIERLNPTLNAFVTLTADQALKDARGVRAMWVHQRWSADRAPDRGAAFR